MTDHHSDHIAADKMVDKVLGDSTLAFIGSGTMAEAMIQALVRIGNLNPDRIIASGPRAARGEELRARYAIRVTTDNTMAEGWSSQMTAYAET
jgi:pyrroline-5-carboxylate reductase